MTPQDNKARYERPRNIKTGIFIEAKEPIKRILSVKTKNLILRKLEKQAKQGNIQAAKLRLEQEKNDYGFEREQIDNLADSVKAIALSIGLILKDQAPAIKEAPSNEGLV